MSIVAGVDFGTASVRVSIVHSERGSLGFGSATYPVLRRHDDPNFATQRHADHCRALEEAFRLALDAADIAGREIAALAIDATGSTVAPVDESLEPLDDYYLWCDHRAWREAAQITARAREQQLPALDWCGGTYSSEWGFAKVLHWLRTADPERRRRFHTAVEHCDLIVSVLCGNRDPAKLVRSVCAMGHKWMWNAALGGLPSQDFLSSIDPLLEGLNQKLEGPYRTSDHIAGRLCLSWAQRLGVQEGMPIAVGALDAHWDAIGAGCRLGDIVNVVGTSTCVMAVSDKPQRIPGVSGIVEGSIHPHRVGIEAGLSAVGDVFEAIARRAGTTLAALSSEIVDYRPGQTGLLRLVWDNGDRSILANPHLCGVTVGWRLHHTAADEFFAAIEGTAFHTRIILEHLQQYGVPVERVIHAGGIPQHNHTLNRVYANVIGKPVLVPARDISGWGSAIFAFLAAGTFRSVEEAQQMLSPGYRVIEPAEDDVRTYEDIFARFRNWYLSLGQNSRSF